MKKDYMQPDVKVTFFHTNDVLTFSVNEIEKDEDETGIFGINSFDNFS